VTLAGLWALATLSAPPAQALDAALTLASGSLGPISGDNTIPGRAGTIVVEGYADAAVTPTSTSGTPTGAPTCRPLIVRKPFDKATPLLARAWSTGDVITSFALRFYGSAGGSTVNTFTIQLSNARIVSISRAGGDGDAAPSEQVGFVFASVVYTNELSGTAETVSCTGSPA